MDAAFENEFVGMECQAVALDELKTTRDRLPRELLAALTDAQKRFFVSPVTCDPEWSLLPIAHMPQLPAIQWKLQNLARLKKAGKVDFQVNNSEHR